MKKNNSYDAAAAERVATVPAKRIGQPDELGATCAFLCSTYAGYITGQNVLIDRGTLMQKLSCLPHRARPPWDAHRIPDSQFGMTATSMQ